MTEKTAPSFNVDIHMAGDINAAAMVIQRYAAETGLCVTLSPQSFIYTGGREEGFRVGFINYPRFPADPSEIVSRATDLARALVVQLGQHSYSIVTPNETTWVSRRPGSPSLSEGLTEALKPFVAFADALNEAVSDNIAIGIFADGEMRFGPSGGATVGDLRRVRAALSEGPRS